MSHMPLARRYRPQKFAQVLGQAHAVAALQNALVRSKTAQAYLFCGTRGSGKTTLARLLAKAVNCLQPSDEGEPCSTCDSCRAMQSGSHLDVIEIDGASHRGIDDVRQIKETVSFQPTLGKFKVYIIDEVHMLTKEAFNALLKTLEEPPSGVKFIFATTEPHKIPLTILSRCQRFQLRRITPTTIRDHLKSILDKEGISYDEPALIEISQRAEGSLRDSLSLLDQLMAFQPGHVSYTNVQELLGLTSDSFIQEYEKAVQMGSNAQGLQLIAQLLEMGIEGSYFLEQLQEHYRRLLQLICRVSGEELTSERRSFYEGLIPFYRQSDIIYILNFLQQSLQQAKLSLQPRLHLEITILHLIQKPWLYSIDHLISRLQQLEQRLSGVSCENSALSQPPYPPQAVTVPPAAAGTVSPAPVVAAVMPTPVAPTPVAPTPVVPAPLAAIAAAPVAAPVKPVPVAAPVAPVPTAKAPATPKPASATTQATTPPPASSTPLPSQEQLPPGRYEGLIHFAAKELGGHLR